MRIVVLSLWVLLSLAGVGAAGPSFISDSAPAVASQPPLYTFKGGFDGYDPEARLVADPAGVLYGTTQYGGGGGCSSGRSTGCGTVFKLVPPGKGKPAWTEKVIYRFSGGPGDGARPLAGLVFDGSGALYGTTSRGGSAGAGTVFKLTPPTARGGSWGETVLHSFEGGPGDGAEPLGGLVFGAGGAMYGTTAGGGGTGHGTVFALLSNGHDAAGDFEQGWRTGQNPNGPWSYGYSSSFTGPVTLYDQTKQGPLNGPNTQYWLSSKVDTGESPAAEYNNGPAFSNGNVNFLANEFLLVAGIGGQFSNLVFTAPESGTYTVKTSFRGAQNGVGTTVAVLVNNTKVFASKVTAIGQIVSFNTTVSMPAGETVRISVGPGGGSQNTGVSATITDIARSGLTETVLYGFCPKAGHCADGAAPAAGLVVDGSGKLYGTTYSGGAGGFGTVFELSPPAGGKPAWAERVLHSFAGGSSGDRNPAAGLAADADGALYGTTTGGGQSTSCLATETSGCGAIFRLAPPAPGSTVWTPHLLHSFTGGSDGAVPLGEVILDKNGLVYGTTGGGGGVQCFFGCGTVFRLAPPAAGGTPWTETLLYRFAAKNPRDGLYPAAGVVGAQGGALYGTTSAGGGNACQNPTGTFSCGAVFEVTGSGFTP